MSWPISKWLVNDEDMGHKTRKRYIYIYMVPDFFLEYERLMNTTHVFFLGQFGRVQEGSIDLLGHQIEVASLKNERQPDPN